MAIGNLKSAANSLQQQANSTAADFNYGYSSIPVIDTAGGTMYVTGANTTLNTGLGTGGSGGVWGAYTPAGETSIGRFIRLRRDMLHLLGDNHDMPAGEKELVTKLIEYYDSQLALNKLKG